MSLIKKIGLLTLGQGINVLVSILFLPYMARALSYEEYGSYGQALMIISIVIAFLTFGLSQLITVYLADESKNDNISISSNIVASLFLGLTGTVLTYLSADYFGIIFKNSQLPELIRIYSFSIFLSIPFYSLNSFFIFKDRLRLSVLISVFTNTLKIILVIISIQYFKSLPLVLWSMVFISFLQFIISIIYIKNHLVFKIKFQLVKEQIFDGFPMGLTTLVTAVMLYTDSAMVSSMLGIKEYAIFRNGAIDIPFVSTLYGSIAAIVLPEVAKLWQKGEIDELFKLKKKVIMNTIYILYPILFFLFFNAQTIITAYLGSKYSESAIIFVIFNITMLIRVNFYADILISAKRNRYVLKVFLFVVVVNVVVNYFLISLYGTIGAAISTVFSVALLSGILLVKTLSISEKKISDLVDLKKIVIVIVSVLIVGFGISMFTHLFDNKYIRLGIFFVCYSIIILLFFNKMKFFSKEIYLKLLPAKIVNIFYK